ncbi:MAG TPA: oligogalacturonate lyase family protein [Steroidobacter sp.]|uniref:oligogalacturonate lyase family protein n=1 Tax=Steroidobacter sp. TaxID=1978227 RepID=UPI002EDABDA2
MRTSLSATLTMLTMMFAGTLPARAADQEPPTEWIDQDTAHRVVRLSKEPGTASLYFHQNSYSPDGKKLIVTTKDGLATIDLETRKITPIAKGDVRVMVTGRKSGNVYYTRQDEKDSKARWVYATNMNTLKTRKIAKIPRGNLNTVNADETLLLGSWVNGEEVQVGAPPKEQQYGPDGKPITYHQARGLRIRQVFEQRLERTIFTVNIATGEIKSVHTARDWLNHLQFSPTDPTLIMFCHEGPWHEVDRLWTIRTDGSQLTKVHERTMHMEIAGHEFFSKDGKTIWYDLQTPRSGVFWVAGYNLETHERTWYNLTRDQWSIHYNVNADGTMFAGDGGDEVQVAQAKDGKWIYLFRPVVSKNLATGPVSKQNLIHGGHFEAERLVNMKNHDYRLEPNVTFTPDQKWVVFRSNMHGPTHVYAVEIAKANAAPDNRTSAQTSSTAAPKQPIDRQALTNRHNPELTSIDPSAPLMVGNGNIAFTADITGLQTFQDQYSALVPLMTQAQWAWHSFPNPQGFKESDGETLIDVRGKKYPYAYYSDWKDAAKPAIAWLRENPHRFSLGRLSLHLKSSDGKTAKFADLSNTQQTLDLWSGSLQSRFTFDGNEVQVRTRVHPTLDMIMVELTSPLLARGQLGVDLKFPGVSAKLNPDPADWNRPDKHQTIERKRDARQLTLDRILDDTRYHAVARADSDVTFAPAGPHSYRILPAGKPNSLTLMVAFAPETIAQPLPTAAVANRDVASHWRDYWTKGAAVDFSGSTDPRAAELERRVVLSQYLMALNGAGTVPPQEEGLFSNSWNGKFHLEMHLWHSAQFALWGRPELLERSMSWYLDHLPDAKKRAARHDVRGAWWPKMVGPEGRNSPSKVSPFIMWQQPHPIYMAELLYRAKPTRETLTKYRELVSETADLLASFPHFDQKRGQYVLGPPIIPAQEVFSPLETFNPTFELEYFRFGLTTAQQWRERLSEPRNPDWDRVLAKLSPLPVKDGLYLATESFPSLWDQARSAECSNGKTRPECFNRDHPSFLGALGLLPGAGVDQPTMKRTLAAVQKHWDLRQTWGWDYPLIAMTAARLNEPETAVNFLLFDAKNNQFGSSGMTPRVHLDEHADSFVPTAEGAAKPVGPDGPGYTRAAETYFPSNGGLLLAVGMMAGGWDGASGDAPGFPKEGWVVRAEGFRALP